MAWIVAVMATAVACSSVKKVVVKDVPLQEQERIQEEYKDRTVWTRSPLQDLGEGGVIPRDEKLVVVEVGLVMTGSVTVQTLKKKNKVVAGLDLERPITKEKIDKRMAELFFFDDPTIRHVTYIRKYGKKTARAIMEHDLYAGMQSEAVLESWGLPIRKKVTETNTGLIEQWAYPTANPQRPRYVYLKDGKVEKWDE